MQHTIGGCKPKAGLADGVYIPLPGITDNWDFLT
jgi:hypothetical protein